EAGAGIPLLCLHTAGADGRQYRALLNDPEVTRHFRVIAFDLPWHGKSAPPEGFQDETYLLSVDRYVETIMAVSQGLGLDRPVVMGCSIGGRVVLHLMMRHLTAFRAVIGLQTGLEAAAHMKQQTLETEYLHRSDVHGPEATAGLLYGIMAPQSPISERWETLWHYMQGGPGVFVGDCHFYKEDGNLTVAQLAGIDTRKTPLYLLSGEYDYSSTPEMTGLVAEAISGSKYQRMTQLGHFPMSENYPHFREYLLPVLREISASA
ncbi:MAG: alpha/beta fold hydrolase, partial [Janthinobacterium lividum]